jgi:hypothetical protein
MKKSRQQSKNTKNTKNKVIAYTKLSSEFTKLERNTLRRLGYFSILGNPYLYSSVNEWIEKTNRINYSVKQKGKRRTLGFARTGRTIMYSLIRKNLDNYSELTITENPDFKLFIKELKKISKEK